MFLASHSEFYGGWCIKIKYFLKTLIPKKLPWGCDDIRSLRGVYCKMSMSPKMIKINSLVIKGPLNEGFFVNFFLPLGAEKMGFIKKKKFSPTTSHGRPIFNFFALKM